MKVSAKQVFTAIIAMICTLGVLWGGQRLYQTTVVQTPLMASLGAIHGVTEATMNGGRVTVRMRAGSDLMSVYRTVWQAADQALGHAPASVTIVSHPDATLNAVSASAQFIIAQGEATGQFVAMRDNLVHLAGAHQASASVELGSHHLYLTFHHQGAVLYEVVPVTIGGGSHG